MYRLLEIGDTTNSPTNSYYVESLEELAEIKDPPVGSTVMMLTEAGLSIKMWHSSGRWIDI